MDKRAIADLARSGITPAQAEAAGMFSIDDASALFPEFHALPSLIMPYFDITGAPMTFPRDGKDNLFCRARYLETPPQRASFVKQKPQRYGQPHSSGTRAYFPHAPHIDWQDVAGDARTPVVITEGEKKALAMCCTLAPTIGLGGVANFILKQTGELLTEFDAFHWRGRTVFIAFDSDAALNPNIQAAEARLVDELMRKRGAKVHIVRLPTAQDGSKVGLDDYLVEHGAEKLGQLIEGTEALGAVDGAVLALNAHVCLIARDGAVYDMRGRHFLKTEFFKCGSEYSAITARRVVTTGKAPGVKEIQVASAWLTHPLAQRYADLLFRPGEDALVMTDAGQPALNVWHGWDATAGDVQPFLDLTDYVFSNLPPDQRDFALKLMAYKAQNPTAKTFAVVLTGDQGGGKSLWSQAIAAAFKPYACNMSSKEFLADFTGWMERTLLAVVNEAKPGHLEEASEALKSFITESDQMMNE